MSAVPATSAPRAAPAWAPPRVFARWIAAGICCYQRFISPHKGFVCAHRALHHGASCSEHIRRAVLEQGVLPALAAARMRFQARRDAKHILLQKSLEERMAEDALEKERRLKSLPGPPSRWLDTCGCVGDGCAVAACPDW